MKTTTTKPNLMTGVTVRMGGPYAQVQESAKMESLATLLEQTKAALAWRKEWYGY